MDPNQFDPSEMGAQGDDQPEFDAEAARAMAWNALEGRVFNWFDSLMNRIENKRATSWSAREEARAEARKIEEAGQADRAISEAFTQVQMKFVRFVMTYMEHHQNPNMNMNQLTTTLADLIVEVHNPSTQEAILLAVSEDHRDLARERLEEFGMALWGVYEVISGSGGGNKWFLIDTIAAMHDADVAEVVESIDGVSVGDLPQEYRQ